MGPCRFATQPPMFAFVIWPDFDPDEPLSCIYIDGIPAAMARGAVLVGREDEVRASVAHGFNPPRFACGADLGDETT